MQKWKEFRGGEGLLLLAATIWGFAFVFQRSAMEHMGPLFFSGLRMGLATVFLLIVAKLMLGRISFEFADLKRGVILGLLLTAGNGLQQIGLVTTTAGKAGFITGLYMVFIPIMLAIFWRRKVRIAVLGGVALATLGLFFLCVSVNEVAPALGDLCVLGCAVIFSFHIIVSAGFSLRTHPVLLCAIQVGTASLLSFVASLLFESPSVSQISSVWIELLYAGVISAGIGFTLQLAGQRRCEPALAAIIMSLEAVFAVLGGILFLDEQLTIRQVWGCMLMFAGILVTQLRSTTEADALLNSDTDRARS